MGSPVVAGPVVGPPPGCSTCSSGFDPGPVAYAMPVSGPVSVGAPPVFGPAMPLGNPRIEMPTPMPGAGVPKN
jgi:hypothetical protein